MGSREREGTPADRRIDSALRNFRVDEAELDTARRDRIAERVAATLDAENALPQTVPPVASGQHRTLKIWIGVLGAAAAVLVVALAAVLIRPAPQNDVVAGPAPMSRNDFVVAARGSADHRLLSSSQLYRRVLVADRRPQGAVVVRTTETWVAEDGSGKLEASAESVLDGRAPKDLSMSPKLAVTASPGELDFAGFTYVQLRGLPADGHQLLREVERRVRSEDPASPAVASLLAELLSLEVVPPPVRAAAVDSLFLIGARPVGEARAPDGRVGEALLGTGEDGREWVLILDQHARSIAFVSGGESLWSGRIEMAETNGWTTFGATALTRIGD